MAKPNRRRQPASQPTGPRRSPPAPRPARPTPTDLVAATIEAVALGHLDNDLAVLVAVINERVQLLAATRSITTLASLRIGDRVRINHAAKPNYLHGQAGTVTGWAGKNIVVQLDQPIGRFTTGELRCPPIILEPGT